MAGPLLSTRWRPEVTKCEVGLAEPGLILENTFTSIDGMVDKIFPYVSAFKGLILCNHWKSIDIIDKVTCPILFIIADKDELVPPVMNYELFEKATSAARKDRVACGSPVRHRRRRPQRLVHDRPQHLLPETQGFCAVSLISCSNT